MPNYLTKEEVRQWRSSLEKITLEEFAARLGKTVEKSKPTNDVVDIVMSRGTSSNTNRKDSVSDGFAVIAERAFRRERQISHTPFSISKNNVMQEDDLETPSKQDDKLKEIVGKALGKTAGKKQNATILEEAQAYSSRSGDINIVLNKSLTDREQLVFEYFLNNINKTVFAKDLAEILELPRDYVYKYIKNLRAKIEGDKLKNVPSGGFMLTD